MVKTVASAFLLVAVALGACSDDQPVFATGAERTWHKIAGYVADAIRPVRYPLCKDVPTHKASLPGERVRADMGGPPLFNLGG